ncbi:non-specific lipid-transfer protein 1-like [Cicer arietinum]|uniref:Non-specific lipid-transfer protein n=1 Tax=Cicer arietinum TaxID=3827 RepID=A0A1S2YL97_CICAR|nr:non-specific lipid-transfer protein 1-like [Cicer arietinum]
MGYSALVSKLVCFAILCLVTFGPKAEGAVTCGQVVNNLTSCVSYIMYGGNTVPAQCCNGVRNLNAMAQTTPDRRAVCSCIKNAVSSSGFTYSNTNLNLAASLPRRCGVNIPYQISPNTDCNSVH